MCLAGAEFFSLVAVFLMDPDPGLSLEPRVVLIATPVHRPLFFWDKVPQKIMLLFKVAVKHFRLC